jgi:hypothetical protein
VANYRVSTNANNNSNETIQDKTNKKTTKETTKYKENGSAKAFFFALKHELLKISVHLQTAFQQKHV